MVVAKVQTRLEPSRSLLAAVAAIGALCASSSCVLTERELGANLSCESSNCECEPGWADCDGDPVTGCELLLTSDPFNCGACGHDCLGGECVDGQCQPVVIYESFTYSSISIALGSSHLFWREERVLSSSQTVGLGSLMAMDLAGGRADYLVSDVPGTKLAVGAETLFWTALVNDEVWLRAVSLTTSERDVARVSTDSQFKPKCLVADDTRVYVGAEDYLLEVDPTDGTATPIAAWQSLCDVMVRAGDFVAWMDPSMNALHTFDVVLRQERAFPAGDVLPTWTSVLAASPTAAYWVVGLDPVVVRSVSIATGEVTDFASLASEPSSMVVAEPNLYVGRAGAGVIESIPLAGGAPVEMATGQATLESLRASADAIYFSSGRRIKRLAR